MKTRTARRAAAGLAVTAGLAVAVCLGLTGQALAFWKDGGRDGGALAQLGLAAGAEVPAVSAAGAGAVVPAVPAVAGSLAWLPSLEFRAMWNGEQYVCRNARGEEGFNRIERIQLLATLDGECADLSGMDLREAYLSGANLVNARLAGASLAGARLSKARLVEADLAKSDLSGAVLDFADLTGSILVHARFGKLGDGSCTSMRWANLAGANLIGVKASCSDFNSADLSRADVREADLAGADLSDASFKGSVYGPDTRFPRFFNPLNYVGMRRVPSLTGKR